jgi:hypothetical protein
MDGRVSPAQTTTNVIFKTQSHYVHMVDRRVNTRATLEESLDLPLPNLYFECPVRDPLSMPTEIKSTQKRRKHKWTIKFVL